MEQEQKRKIEDPVHHVFSNKVAGRGLATAFERNKPHVNIGKFLSLVTLESSSQATAGDLVAKDMVDRVDGSWTQQGGPAC
jgi:hypothetical protein